MTEAWTHDWKGFAYKRLGELGFDSVLEYVHSQETWPYAQLADNLGGSKLAPIHIQRLLREEVQDSSTHEYYIRSSLVRNLHEHLPNGLRMHDEWNLTLALSSWAGSMDDSDQPRCMKIAKKLKKLSDVSDNWLPESDNDPVIEMLASESLRNG